MTSRDIDATMLGKSQELRLIGGISRKFGVAKHLAFGPSVYPNLVEIFSVCGNGSPHWNTVPVASKKVDEPQIIAPNC